MGRAGDGIYDSDKSLEALSEITGLVMREAVYKFAPEQVGNPTRAWAQPITWLRETLTLIEILLMFAEDDRAHSTDHLMYQETAIKRWREAFFEVWDREGDDYDIPYGRYAYRVEQRSAVVSLFDHLNNLAENWNVDVEYRQIPPFALAGKLPYFSSLHLRHPDGYEYHGASSFLGTFLNRLIQMIVLPDENRESSGFFRLDDLEEVWVAVEVLGFFAERYQTPAGLTPETVHRWLDTTTIIWLNFLEHEFGMNMDTATLLAEDGLYRNSVAIFVRLIAAVETARDF